MLLNQTSFPKTDRRIQRTRAALLKALMELIVECGYDSITIQDITERANVARTTFYLHYATKEELLYNGLYNQYQELLSSIKPGQMDSALDWKHLAENEEFYKVMFGEHGSQFFTVQLFKFLQTMMLKQVVGPLSSGEVRLPVDLIAASLAGAQYGIWSWWLNNGQPMPIEEIAQAGEMLARYGLSWAVGSENLKAE